MSQIGKNPLSMFRETKEEFLKVIDDGALSEKINKILVRKEDGSVKYPESAMRVKMYQIGIRKKLIWNALHLQNYSITQVDSIMEGLKDFAEQYGVTGFFEFHANDNSQNSNHIHLWTNNDSKDIYNLIRGYIIYNGYANADNIDIEGKFDSFLEKMNDSSLSEDDKQAIKDNAITEYRSYKSAEDILYDDREDYDYEYKPKEEIEDSNYEKEQEVVQEEVEEQQANEPVVNEAPTPVEEKSLIDNNLSSSERLLKRMKESQLSIQEKIKDFKSRVAKKPTIIENTPDTKDLDKRINEATEKVNKKLDEVMKKYRKR